MELSQAIIHKHTHHMGLTAEERDPQHNVLVHHNLGEGGNKPQSNTSRAHF